MLEIINDVIDAEKKAEALVTQARREVQERESAQEGLDRSRLQDARSSADSRVLDRIATIRRDAEATYEQRISEARKHAELFLVERESAIETAVSEAVRLVEAVSTQT